MREQVAYTYKMNEMKQLPLLLNNIPNGKNAKPILKWAGGKTQILEEIINRLPNELHKNKILRYIEPFVGGGAVFFYIASHFPTVELIISDINPELILLYKTIKENVEELIRILGVQIKNIF